MQDVVFGQPTGGARGGVQTGELDGRKLHVGTVDDEGALEAVQLHSRCPRSDHVERAIDHRERRLAEIEEEQVVVRGRNRDLEPVEGAAPRTPDRNRDAGQGGDAPDGQSFPGRPNDRLALVTFASTPATVCPLTLNHTVLLKVLDDQKTQDALTAGTNIGDALGEALVRLNAGAKGRTVIVLLSDGEHNKAGTDTLKPIQSAILAEKLRVPIYTIDCGGDPTGDDPESGQQRTDGRRVMERVAETTGGRSFIANSGADLVEVFRSIDALERTPIDSFRYRRYRDFGIPVEPKEKPE